MSDLCWSPHSVLLLVPQLSAVMSTQLPKPELLPLIHFQCLIITSSRSCLISISLVCPLFPFCHFHDHHKLLKTKGQSTLIHTGSPAHRPVISTGLGTLWLLSNTPLMPEFLYLSSLPAPIHHPAPHPAQCRTLENEITKTHA